jgi:hypothetical protein
MNGWWHQEKLTAAYFKTALTASCFKAGSLTAEMRELLLPSETLLKV